MRVIRVFPRRTKATPDDALAVVGRGPELFDVADEIHVSVTFSWDLPLAEKLATAWKFVAPVRIGGPATGERGGDFVPGMYLRNGYTITSRGCPNRCWFCSVWKREGDVVRELPIRDGWNVQDDNLLACSDSHIENVFKMLARQPRSNPPEFKGGLEAKRLKPWHCVALKNDVWPNQVFFAYDTLADLKHLQSAGEMMRGAGWKLQQDGGRALRCYVLCGYQKDTEAAAEKRMEETMQAGFVPMAMLYRDATGKRERSWMTWARQWARPAIIFGKLRDDVRAIQEEGRDE